MEHLSVSFSLGIFKQLILNNQAPKRSALKSGFWAGPSEHFQRRARLKPSVCASKNALGQVTTFVRLINQQS